MNPAPMTPNTLALIREAAMVRQASEIAEMLGWDLARLRRVARQHSIELLNPEPSMPAPKPVQAPGVPPNAALEAVAAELSSQQAAILRVLHGEMDAGNHDFLSGTKIAAQIGIMDVSLSTIMQATNRKVLMLSRWKIDTRKGPEGGYRLLARRSDFISPGQGVPHQ